MALLTKLRSATLIEALVATVLIVIVFVVASLILSNLLFNAFSRNTHAVENRMFELEYQIQNKLIKLPYREEFNKWDIVVESLNVNNESWLVSTATNKDNKKEVFKSKMHATN